MLFRSINCLLQGLVTGEGGGLPANLTELDSAAQISTVRGVGRESVATVLACGVEK